MLSDGRELITGDRNDENVFNDLPLNDAELSKSAKKCAQMPLDNRGQSL